MNSTRLLAAAAAAGMLASGAAWADRGHHYHGRSHVNIGIGIGFGAPYRPWYGPPARYYYPPPYYYGPAYYPPVVIERAPPVYVEREPLPAVQAPVTTPPAPVWYYCASAEGYYPYVQNCPEGWQSVAAQPPR